MTYLLAVTPCDRCQQPAPRFSTAHRIAIDLDLERPILLLIKISVHRCTACEHYFRAQPPFLRPDAIYTNRVVTHALDSVFRDGMAMRRVPERLARDFWVQPSEGMVRQWCRAYQTAFDFATDYQPWVVGEFSGVLCVDEVYQHELALLLAVDPAAPDGDRLVGYQLVHGSVDAEIVNAFLTRLRDAGVQPDEVVTDGSALYPTVLAKVWPTAAHQLCLFHETRRVTRATMAVIQAVRRAIPMPQPAPGVPWHGRLSASPPSDDPEDPTTRQWHLRHAARQAAIAQVHALAQEGLSQAAIARQLGLHRRTVKAWLKLEPPTEVAPEMVGQWHAVEVPSQDSVRRTARQAKHEQVRSLAEQGLSYSAIARAVNIHRVTVKKWLQAEAGVSSTQPTLPGSTEPDAADAAIAAPLTEVARTATPPTTLSTDRPQLTSRAASLEAAPPPAPWTSWEEVRRVREALQEHRFLLLRRPAHLTVEQQAQVTALLNSPVGPPLRVARAFLEDWYALWTDEHGQRRTLAECQTRYEAWRTHPSYHAVAALRRVQERISTAHFERLSPFLRHPRWEATNNGAERMGRAFRHRQAPHFNLREQTSIDGALIVMACQRKARATGAFAPSGNRCLRGRKAHTPTMATLAA